jgi:hypothetical protein
MKRTSLPKRTKYTTQRPEGRKLHTQPKEKLKVKNNSSFGFENQTRFRSSSYLPGSDLTVNCQVFFHVYLATCASLIPSRY